MDQHLGNKKLIIKLPLQFSLVRRKVCACNHHWVNEYDHTYNLLIICFDANELHVSESYIRF